MKRLVLVLFVFIPVAAFAQVAQEMDILLETNAVTAAVAAHFALGAAGLLPREVSGADARTAAYETARSRGWVSKGPGEEITLQEAAFLIMNVFQLKGGVMYFFFNSPRYAYREMIYRRLIQGRAYSNMKVSGKRFLQILSSTLNYTGEREMTDAMLNSGGLN